jgi:predicted kinase
VRPAGLGQDHARPSTRKQTPRSSLFSRRVDEARRAQIEALQWKIAQDLLASGLTVIIEWGTWGKSERDTLRLGARVLGAAVELHYLSAPEDILLERIQSRGIENPPITRDDLSRWIEIFQAPTAEELALFDPPSSLEP